MMKQYDDKTLKKLQQTEIDMLADIIDICEKYDINYFGIYGTLIGAIRHNGFIPWDDDMDIGMFREDYEKFEKVFDRELGDKYDLMTPLREKGFASTVIKVEKKGTKFVPECSKKMKCKQGIFIDIFIYDKVSSDQKLYQKQAKKTRFLARLIFLAGSPDPEIPLKGITKVAAEIICKSVHYLLKIVPGIHVFLYKKFEKYSTMANGEETDIYVMFQDNEPDKSIAKKSDILPCKQIAFDGVQMSIPQNYDDVLRKRYGEYMTLPPVAERVNHAAYILDFGED